MLTAIVAINLIRKQSLHCELKPSYKDGALDPFFG